MVLSVAEKVTEQGPVVVLFWYGALELMDPERVVVRLQGRVEDAEPVVLL
jgi:putative hemolysin